MAKIKECYEVSINGKNTLIQVSRTEKKEERNKDGTYNTKVRCEIIDDIMTKYFNTDNWTIIGRGKDKTIKIRLKI